ncbi:MAG: carbonic anhydrase, partial [Proteobacteria bacterium]|nr:carbonic anhydrase [Pseudomonadota bacterium]
QHPIAVILACIDSRVPVETIFDMSFGDIFCVRVAGNVVNDDVIASIEYACHVAGAKLIVTLGHTRCGAIAAACDQVEKGHITQLLSKIKPAIAAEKEIKHERNGANHQFISEVAELNIANSLQQLYKNSDILRLMIQQESIGLVGALYDVNTGKVSFKSYAEEITLLDHGKDNELGEKLNNVFSKANESLSAEK